MADLPDIGEVKELLMTLKRKGRCKHIGGAVARRMHDTARRLALAVPCPDCGGKGEK